MGCIFRAQTTRPGVAPQPPSVPPRVRPPHSDDVAGIAAPNTRIDGAPAIAAIVDDFYARVLADEALAPFFAGHDLDRLKGQQARFVGYALGGPNQYAGRGMRRAHAGLAITEAQFSAVAGHFADALTACGVPAPLVAEVIAHVAQLQPDIVGQ